MRLGEYSISRNSVVGDAQALVPNSTKWVNRVRLGLDFDIIVWKT